MELSGIEPLSETPV